MERQMLSHEYPDVLGETYAHLILLARHAGADFVEIFSEVRNKMVIEWQYKRGLRYTPQIHYGVGIRVQKGSLESYASTTLITPSNLEKTLEKALYLLNLKKRALHSPLQVYENPPLLDFAQKDRWSFEDLPPIPHLADLVMEGAKTTEQYRLDTLQSCTLKFSYDYQDVYIANSEGVWSHDQRLNQSVRQQVLLVDGAHRYTAYAHEGEAHHPAFLSTFNWDEFVNPLMERAQLLLKADFVEPGVYPVVLSPGIGAVIFHEACGHLLETTCVRKKLSPFQNLMNQQIAHPCISAIDTGLYPEPYAYGNLRMDDEGMATQSTLLIEKGILRNFLADRRGSLETGYPRTGSARREDYRFAPTSRMRNTLILPGTDHFDDMIRSIEHGYFCKQLGGGAVSTTGEFNFGVDEAYEIRNGEITKPVKGALLIGDAKEILQNISMCSQELSLSPGLCGSVSGTVYVTVGQPYIKVDKLLIGGQKS